MNISVLGFFLILVSSESSMIVLVLVMIVLVMLLEYCRLLLLISGMLVGLVVSDVL